MWRLRLRARKLLQIGRRRKQGDHSRSLYNTPLPPPIPSSSFPSPSPPPPSPPPLKPSSQCASPRGGASAPCNYEVMGCRGGFTCAPDRQDQGNTCAPIFSLHMGASCWNSSAGAEACELGTFCSGGVCTPYCPPQLAYRFSALILCRQQVRGRNCVYLGS